MVMAFGERFSEKKTLCVLQLCQIKDEVNYVNTNNVIDRV